jgi:integrase/recombinase XerD
LPAIFARAGPQAARRTLEFFTAQIRNPHTRQAYAHATARFFHWCDAHHLALERLTPVAIAAYVEDLQRACSAPTVKQHLAAIRMLFDYWVVGQVLPMNPAAAVRGPKHVVKKGKTPVLQPDEARLLLESIDVSVLAGQRDRALIGVMIYSFARVSAVTGMAVGDYYQQGKRWWLRLHEKGGKHHEVPAHHKAEAYLDAYLAAAGLEADLHAPLWQTLTRARTGTDPATASPDRRLTGRRLTRFDVFRLMKRRVRAAGLGAAANCHTCRATGITAYLLNGGTLEQAQAIAAHESPRTTKLYDRTPDTITLEEIEKIAI